MLQYSMSCSVASLPAFLNVLFPLPPSIALIRTPHSYQNITGQEEELHIHETSVWTTGSLIYWVVNNSSSSTLLLQDKYWQCCEKEATVAGQAQHEGESSQMTSQI